MKNVILLHETVFTSLMRDASTFAMFVALIGIGVLLDSSALQWTGAMLGFLAIVARSSKVQSDARMTIRQAREYLDKLEARR